MKHLLPGNRQLAEKCKNFTKQNIKSLTNIVVIQKDFSRQGLKEILKACHMCGYINGEHWHNNECPGPDGSALSEGMFVIDEELTQFSESLFEFLGGKLNS